MAFAGMIIEFTGLIGSGKSTLSQSAKRYLQSSGITAYSPMEAGRFCFDRSRIGRAISKWIPTRWRGKAAHWIFTLELRLVFPFLFTLAHPMVIAHIFRTAPAIHSLPVRHRRIILRLFFEVAGLFYFLRKRLQDGEVVLFEEGLIHRAINLYAWEPGKLDRGTVAEYLRRIPPADVAVRINAPLSLGLERARARGLPVRLRDKHPQQIERFIENSATILSLVNETGKKLFFEVDNSADLDHSISALNQALGYAIPPVHSENFTRTHLQSKRMVAGQLVYEGKPVFLIPRPDQLLTSISSRMRPLNGNGQKLQQILAAFGLPFSGEAASPPGSGRSENWIVATPSGRKFLKCYKGTVDREAILQEHSILAYLAEVDFPAPRLFSTPEGHTFIERNGKFYALYDFLEGYFQYHNYVFSPSQKGDFITACGQALGVLHNTLRDIEPAGSNPNGFQSKQGTRWRELPWYLDQLQQVRQTSSNINGSNTRNLSREISRQASWLEERLQELDETLFASGLTRLIIHGDYGPYNVFFKPGAPIMILDYELSRLDWCMTDLANAAYFFALGRSGFSFSHLARFFEGYLRVNPDAGSETRFLPDVWQFLLLRRVIVCWRRALETSARTWQAEAQRKLNLAHWIDNHRELLSNPEGSKPIFSQVGR